MEANFWVKIEANKRHNRWNSGAVEVRKQKPATKANEVAVRITLNIPDAYFETPELSARISVPESAVNKTLITPEVQTNIGNLISQQLGVKVHISADDPDKTPEDEDN